MTLHVTVLFALVYVFSFDSLNLYDMEQQTALHHRTTAT